MSRANPIVEAAADTLNAYEAVRRKIGSHRVRGTSEGLEIHRVGWPVLLITHEAARRWASEVDEAEAGQ